jgi:hypothetical protein
MQRGEGRVCVEFCVDGRNFYFAFCSAEKAGKCGRSGGGGGERMWNGASTVIKNDICSDGIILVWMVFGTDLSNAFCGERSDGEGNRRRIDAKSSKWFDDRSCVVQFGQFSVTARP